MEVFPSRSMPNHRSNTLSDSLKIDYKQVMEDLHILENENTEALDKFKESLFYW